MFESRSLKEAKSGMSHISPHATADAGGTFERSACRFACILVFRAIVELGDGAVSRSPDMEIPALCLLREWRKLVFSAGGRLRLQTRPVTHVLVPL
jgi:hypothetical protein